MFLASVTGGEWYHLLKREGLRGMWGEGAFGGKEDNEEPAEIPVRRLVAM